MSQSSFQGFISPRPDKKGGSGSNIKSIQQGVSAMPSSTTQNVTLPIAVDTTKSVVIINPTGNSSLDAALMAGALTSPTNLQVTTFASSPNNFTWLVVEYQNIKSFQSGTLLTAGSLTTNITAVNAAKSMLYFNYKTVGGASTNLIDSFLDGYISNSTTVTFSKNGAVNFSINWFIVEIY